MKRTSMWPAAVAVTAALLCTAGPEAAAQDLAALAGGATAIIDKYCARCHQVGKLKGKYEKDGPAKGFGYVTDLGQLQRKKKIIPGNPDSSPLFIRIAVQKDMPPPRDECYQVPVPEGILCGPSAEEILKIRTFIEQLGTQVADLSPGAPGTRGVPQDDAGAPPAGFPQGDAGAPPAGAQQGDAGAPPAGAAQGDAGAPPAGAQQGDAGAPPAGFPQGEAGAPAGAPQGVAGAPPPGFQQGAPGAPPPGFQQGAPGAPPPGFPQGVAGAPPGFAPPPGFPQGALSAPPPGFVPPPGFPQGAAGAPPPGFPQAALGAPPPGFVPPPGFPPGAAGAPPPGFPPGAAGGPPYKCVSQCAPGPRPPGVVECPPGGLRAGAPYPPPFTAPFAEPPGAPYAQAPYAGPPGAPYAPQLPGGRFAPQPGVQYPPGGPPGAPYVQYTPAPYPQKKFITDDEVIRWIADDLGRISDLKRFGIRYLTLTHFYNIGEDPNLLELYRQATVKLLNSLSLDADPIGLVTIDAYQTIIRFDINDLGWDAKIWDLIVAANPYLVIYKNPLFDGFIVKETKSVTPILRADWFTFAAAQPPLYHDILRLPKTLKELEKLVGIDVIDNINKYRVDRAGFQKSGVSANNRMIERHRIATGTWWQSYDFGGNVTRQSLLRFPLGPQAALPKFSKDFGFKEDGGEIIFSLPNGFHAYYLTDAAGNRLDAGPQNIVIDRKTGRDDFAVRNGVSCFGCHDKGIKYIVDDPRKYDEILPHIERTLILPAAAKDVVRELYPPHPEFSALLDRDAETYCQALDKAGLRMNLRDENGLEPINVLFNRFEEDLRFDQAAAELGFRPEEFRYRLDAGGAVAYETKLRLLQDLVPRDQFVQDFANLVNEITENKAVNFQQIVQKSQEAGGIPTKTAAPPKLSGTFDLAFFPNLQKGQSKFYVDEEITFTVKSDQPCHLTVYNIDGKGRMQVVFPNKYNQKNLIQAGTKYRLPGPSFGGFKIEFDEPGTERVVAVCNASRPEPPGLAHDFAKADYTSFESYGAFVKSADKVLRLKPAEKLLRVKPDGAPAGGQSAPPVLVSDTGADVLAQKGIVLNVQAK